MNKKPNGEGTITSLPSGKYRYRIWVEVDGVEQRKSFTGTSPTACKRRYTEWLQSDNKIAIEKIKLFKDCAELWYKLEIKPLVSRKELAYKTSTNYKNYIDFHINPAIGNIEMSKIRHAHIQKLLAESKNKSNEPLSNSAQKEVRGLIRRIFDFAIVNNYCKNNPVIKTTVIKDKPSTIKVFSQDQMVEIVNYMSEHIYGPHIALLLYTGLRIGELIGLTWQNVDMKNKSFNIIQSLETTENGKEITPLTKNKKTRIVPYDDVLQGFLDKIPKTGMYVLSRQKGGVSTHHTHNSFYRIYDKFFDDLNLKLRSEHENEKQTNDFIEIPNLSPHKCRHTFATFMLRSDVDIRYVQSILGHSKISTTEIYTHVDIEDLRKNISKLKY